MVSETAEGRVVYTVDEVAVLLRISRGSAFDAVRTGAIPSIRIGRRILVPRVALERMLGQGGLGDDSARAPVEASNVKQKTGAVTPVPIPPRG